MRVGIAEDVLLTRQGLRAVLGLGGHTIAWEVSRADLIFPTCIADTPDVLISDVRMPPGNGNDGLHAALELRNKLPQLPILILSQYIGKEYASRLLSPSGGLQSGTGYLLKESVGNVDDFLDTIDHIRRGGVSIDPKVVAHLFSQPQPSRVQSLTPRQREVLQLIARGRTNRQMCDQLFISAPTLERIISQIFVALELSDDDGNKRVLAVLEYLRG